MLGHSSITGRCEAWETGHLARASDEGNRFEGPPIDPGVGTGWKKEIGEWKVGASSRVSLFTFLGSQVLKLLVRGKLVGKPLMLAVQRSDEKSRINGEN